MFPGTYRMSIDNSLMAITTEDTFTITGGADIEVPFFDVELGPGAAEHVTNAAATRLSDCMKEKATYTSCEFGSVQFKFKGKPVTPKPSTVKWSFKGKEPKIPEPDEYAQQTGTVYFHDVNIQIVLRFTGTNGGRYETTYSLDRVEIGVGNPDSLKIRFYVS